MNDLFEPIKMDPAYRRVAASIESKIMARDLNDGDTLQMGVGTVSGSLGKFLGFRNDLGVQTEFITGGIPELVQQGVVTGRRKSLHPGKVVGSGLTAAPGETKSTPGLPFTSGPREEKWNIRIPRAGPAGAASIVEAIPP